MKIDNPQMKFRLETNMAKERVMASQTAESGLEAPEEFWVTLDVYERDNGPADPARIVWEEVDGVRTAGVSWQSNLVLFQFRLNGLIN